MLRNFNIKKFKKNQNFKRKTQSGFKILKPNKFVK